jgi:hypothetical protein
MKFLAGFKRLNHRSKHRNENTTQKCMGPVQQILSSKNHPGLKHGITFGLYTILMPSSLGNYKYSFQIDTTV